MEVGTMEVNLVQNFKLKSVTLVLVVILCEILTSEVPRPTGVSMSRASLYPSDKDFTCFDGSKKIFFTYVNDDYCDCLDGSDEPGTSACPQGVFHCTNAGHKPLNIASSRVNDGVCDCCDGTDEYASDKECHNNCIELGRSAREESQRRADLVKAGIQIKAELIQKSIRLKQEKQAKLDELKKSKEEADTLKAEKEALKKEAEKWEGAALEYYRKLEEEAKRKKAKEEEAKNRVEATEAFDKFDFNRDGYLDISELQVRQTFDKNRDGEVAEDEAKFFLNDQTSVDLNTFITNCWSNVKAYVVMDSGVFKPPVVEGEEQGEVENEQAESQDEEAQDEDDEEQEEEEPEQPEETRQEEPSSSVPYDPKTQELVDKANAVRSQFYEAETQVRNIENEIKSITEYLEKDFGPEEEFATLEGQCFSYEDHEYVYKLCPFDKTSQQPKSGAAEVRLGMWGNWAGPESSKYELMLFERGQSCWNGPQRSTIVKVSCGSENKVLSVSEPNRCEYSFEFVTPAACFDSPSNGQDDLHDEL